MVKKQIFLGFIVFVLLSSAAFAEEWKLASQNKKMCINNSFFIGEYVVTLTDVAINSNGDIFACMFSTYQNGTKIDSVITERGEYAEILDGMYRVLLIRANGNTVHCSCDYLVRPFLVCSSTSTTYTGYNKTVFRAQLVNTDAKNIKIQYTIKNINLKGNKPSQKSYNTLKINENINTTIKWEGAGSIVAKITYKDFEGNEYCQTYDILSNAMREEIKPVKEAYTVEKTITTKKVSPSRITTEKKIFKKAVERAIKYIDFSDESKKDLQRILIEI